MSTTIQNSHCSTYFRAKAQRATMLRALVKASSAGTLLSVKVTNT